MSKFLHVGVWFNPYASGERCTDFSLKMQAFGLQRRPPDLLAGLKGRGRIKGMGMGKDSRR